MNVPTHYNVLNDEAILRDLYAMNFHGSPLLEYVCQRWEQLVYGEKGAEMEVERLREQLDWEKSNALELMDRLLEEGKRMAALENEVSNLRKQNDALTYNYVRAV